MRISIPVMIMIFACCAICSATAGGMSISGPDPGNVFPAGAVIHLSVSGADGSVSYVLTDYFGVKVAHGKADATGGIGTIEIVGQQPGWYQIECKSADKAVTASIAVVIDRGDAPLPADGRVGSDAASSWLVGDTAKIEPLAKMVRMAGIPWLRERYHCGQQDATGKTDWGKYQTVLDALHAEGIHVCDVWHDSPLWMHPTRTSDPYPDDLRDIYRFTKGLSAHFASQVQAWEVWNEPDFGFWLQGGDTFAAYQKAAYLGLKDGNPNVLVLNGSICGGVTSFVHNVYESGMGQYYDIFDWHTYSSPSEYVGQLMDHYKAMRQDGVASRPAWLTECGIHLQGTEGEGSRILNDERQRLQCQFVPRAVSSALASGTQRYFYFVLPDYLENGTQFGALRPDMTPYPSFAALSAAANILGQAKSYLGTHTGSNGLVAHAFKAPKGNVIVAWADSTGEMLIPSNNELVVADIFGKQSRVLSIGGVARVKVGPEAVYVLNAEDAALSGFSGATPYVAKLPKLKPSRVIVAGFTTLPVDKSRNCYMTYGAGVAGTDPTMDYTVEVYNLNEKAGATGKIKVDVPAGWTVSDAERSVTVGPMGKETLKFKIIPGSSILDTMRVTVRPSFKGDNVQPSVSYFRADPATLTPKAEKPLDWTDASKWTPACSPNGKVTVINSAPGVLKFDVKFSGTGDRWAYPEFKLDSGLDLTGYDGISFTMKTSVNDSGPTINMMLIENEGNVTPHYITGTHPYGDTRRVVLLFRDMRPLTFLGEDPDRKLDLNKLTRVKFGCNMTRDDLSFEISDIKAVKLK